MKSLLIIASLSVLAFASFFDEPNNANSKIWAVLVAGSNSYGNYRHQSDVCRSYHTLAARGVPKNQTITFLYDDIANSPSNPFKGKIFNDYRHIDVYAGVEKDYTGRDVNPDVFIKVLTGVDPGVGSRKYLKSGPNDRVFIFFDDHGGDGILAFPSSYLYKTTLAQTISTMAVKQNFGQVVFYIEACEAGSMFYDVSLPKNFYVVTASPITASSWAWQYDSSVGAYLSDVFAQAWMNSTEDGPDSLLFQDQYEYTTTHIDNGSQPCQYGDLSIAKQVNIDEFFGPRRNVGMHATYLPRPRLSSERVASPDVPLETARKRAIFHPTKLNLALFNYEKEIRLRVDNALHNILRAAGLPQGLNEVATPCTVCDSTCKCISGCGGTPACKFECCNIESCYRRYSAVNNGLACSDALTRAWQDQCGNSHPYLRTGDNILSRACRTSAGQHLDLDLALAAVSKECPLRL